MVWLVFTKSQGLVGSFASFNHFLFEDFAFHDPFPSEPLLGSLIYQASLISRTSSLALLYRVICILFSRPLSLLSFIVRIWPHFTQFPYLFCKSISMSHGSLITMQGPWSISLGQICSFNFLGINKVFILIASKVFNIKIV